jgi:hypothetical protein
MKTASITILLAVAAISAWGAFGFGIMEHTSAHPCPLPVMQGSTCPAMINATLLFIHHIFGVQKLTQAVAGVDAGVMLMLLLAFGLFASAAAIFSPPGKEYVPIRRTSATLSSFSRTLIVRWLAVRNKQDAPAPFGTHGYIFLT